MTSPSSHTPNGEEDQDLDAGSVDLGRPRRTICSPMPPVERDEAADEHELPVPGNTACLHEMEQLDPWYEDDDGVMVEVRCLRCGRQGNAYVAFPRVHWFGDDVGRHNSA